VRVFIKAFIKKDFSQRISINIATPAVLVGAALYLKGNAMNQYELDSQRLSEIIHRFTGAPKKKIQAFLNENSAEELPICGAQICTSDEQRNKYDMLYEFMRLFETQRKANTSREYVFNSSKDSTSYITTFFYGTRDKERFAAFFLDAANRLISARVLAIGVISQCIVPAKEIAQEAIFCHAKRVIIAHNHPGGTLKPTKDDIAATSKVKEGLELFDIELIDHIIVADENAVSLAESGYM
jgi:DNA repair protein RadC